MSADTRVIASLASMTVIAGGVVWWAVRPYSPWPVHTTVESGSHLSYVVFTPNGDPDDELVAIVEQGRRAVQAAAQERGMLYSTIGVSLDWSVTRALERLTKLGPFDEVIAGRNLLSSGRKRYISDMDAPGVYPQIVVVLENVRIETSPVTQTIWDTPKEVARLIGRSEIEGWSQRGFRLPGVLEEGLD